MGKSAIGTTKRGIGPAYEDKVARRGVRIMDLADPETLQKKLKELADFHNFMLIEYYKQSPINYESVLSELNSAWAKISPMIVDVAGWLREAIAENKRILFEGAQGSSLDIDHGTYPYVTYLIQQRVLHVVVLGLVRCRFRVLSVWSKPTQHVWGRTISN